MYISENLFPLVNIVMAIWLIVSLVVGYKQGLIWGILRILGVVASIFVSWILADGIASIIAEIVFAVYVLHPYHPRSYVLYP